MAPGILQATRTPSQQALHDPTFRFWLKLAGYLTAKPWKCTQKANTEGQPALKNVWFFQGDYYSSQIIKMTRAPESALE